MIGVGGASPLQSTTRSMYNHVVQRDELFCIAEHDARKRSVQREADHAARARRSFWHGWMRIGCCCSPGVEEAAREQRASERMAEARSGSPMPRTFFAWPPVGPVTCLVSSFQPPDFRYNVDGPAVEPHSAGRYVARGWGGVSAASCQSVKVLRKTDWTLDVGRCFAPA